MYNKILLLSIASFRKNIGIFLCINNNFIQFMNNIIKKKQTKIFYSDRNQLVCLGFSSLSIHRCWRLFQTTSLLCEAEHFPAFVLGEYPKPQLCGSSDLPVTKKKKSLIMCLKCSCIIGCHWFWRNFF